MTDCDYLVVWWTMVWLGTLVRVFLVPVCLSFSFSIVRFWSCPIFLTVSSCISEKKRILWTLEEKVSFLELASGRISDIDSKIVISDYSVIFRLVGTFYYMKIQRSTNPFFIWKKISTVVTCFMEAIFSPCRLEYQFFIIYE